MAESAVVIKSGKIVRIGDVDAEVVEVEAPLVYHDYILENRHNGGIISLSLGVVQLDVPGVPQVQIVSRHRMSVLSAQILRDTLSRLIEAELKPADQSKAN
jgi:hypothetical protein